MIPEAAFAMLACARIGAIHSVVFGGFSAEALRSRIDDAKAKLVITADGGIEGRTGTRMTLGKTSIKNCTTNDSVAVWVVYPRSGYKYPMKNITITVKKCKQVIGSSLPESI
jgi:acetyl-CoA synthetase